MNPKTLTIRQKTYCFRQCSILFAELGSIMKYAALFFLCLLLNGCGFFGLGVDVAPVPKSDNKIVTTACSQMGKKYCPGGSSPQKGFDCSGLVWWTYRQHGITVPRITVDQAKAGKKVAKKDARAGDIMVFKVSNSPRGLHTGIYAGNGKFVHSPSSGKRVCLENLAPWWQSRLAGIRRIAER